MTAYFARQEESETNKRIAEDILKYGETILSSDVFQRAYHQKHHTNTTVAEHTLNVTACALRISYAMEKAGEKVSIRDVTVGALCHDLGIVGRDEKYDSNRMSLRLHPLDSVLVARKLVPGIDHKTEEIIRCHMWPLNGWKPDSKEGYIVMMADKYSSVRELLYQPNIPILNRETKGMILTAMLSTSAA